MKCVYPCVLRPGDSCAAYVVTFPDIPGGTQGKTLYEALLMAEDAANFMTATALEDGDQIPEPTPLDKVEVPEGGFVTLIRVDTDEYLKKQQSDKAVAEKSDNVA